MKKICRKCGVEVEDLIPDTDEVTCDVCHKIDNKNELLKAMNDIWKEEVGK
tara:strand:+ start:6330 stop:6482 length:153 start_codon:yes stop_codon:yes gene_type:complete